MKKFSFLSEKFGFFEVNLSIYLNRRVFVMSILLRTDASETAGWAEIV